ncbi:hypothetical protein [Catellatospora sp. NPDC049609]|uniref:hypothetical protein n=1 Tax=Catellatospora sp. NPDC049609 TaxID=3155505 RepID=UPI003436C950
MTIVMYGPHCSHDECAWDRCDHDGEVHHGCRKQATCPECGPTSEDWPRLAAQWTEWAVSRYGTADTQQLRAADRPANVVETAELIEQHQR